MRNFYAKYRISEINYVKFELVIRCLYNVMPNVYVYVIIKQEDLHFFVTSDDMSQMTLLVSKLSIVVHNTKRTIPSFPIPMVQNVL